MRLIAPIALAVAMFTSAQAQALCTCTFGYSDSHGGTHCTAWDCHPVKTQAPTPDSVLKESDCPNDRALLRTKTGFRLVCGRGANRTAWFPPGGNSGFCGGLLCADGSAAYGDGLSCLCKATR
jgi:hypothetical protein